MVWLLLWNFMQFVFLCEYMQLCMYVGLAGFSAAKGKTTTANARMALKKKYGSKYQRMC